jgi:hypothetical protein
MPAFDVAGLKGSTSELLLDPVSKEAVHPDVLREALQHAGFVGGADRTLTGAHGVFSRVVVRAWAFGTDQGASSFLSWLEGDVQELIGAAARPQVELPTGVVLFLHSPSGCCHEEMPIYLAAWQRGAVVWTIRASGARIHTTPVLALVRSIERET